MTPDNRQRILLRNFRDQIGHLNQSNLFHTLTKYFNKAYLISSIAHQPVLGQGLLVIEASRSHSYYNR